MTVFDSVSDYLAAAGVAIILLPLLVVLGPAAAGVALLLAAVWVLVVKGVPWAADFLKQRHSGAAAKKYEAMTDDRRWGR